jgi:glycosyltransferase involved in cell wall biosynthesis
VFEVLHASVIVLAITHVATLGLLAVDLRRRRPMGPTCAALLGGVAAAAGGAVASSYVPSGSAAVAGAGGIAFFVCYLALRHQELRPAGVAAWSSFVLMTIATSLWGVHFVATMAVSTRTHAIVWTALALVAVSAPSAFIQIREAWEPLMRTRWRRSPDLDPGDLTSFPMVSIHVPCHAEPPNLVISTLDRLAQLDYPDFEVLVIDNNTTDPDLWRPLEEHCAVLGRRFRFLHVEGIRGAKAGALNWAAPHTDPRATLVGVVDADYHVEPDWLRRTVGHFEDATVGFVQCPHAYRDYGNSRFCRMANWEYAVFFTTGMVSLDHHGAGLTVGTMSLIRRAALEDAGGWAEWCLTEDSELSIRIHAAGYRSVYLNEPLGRGLIPETFQGYRQQRFRWTYGPVQELRKHLRLFLPRPFARTSRLDWRQRVHHANHGLDVALVSVRTLAVPIGAVAALSMIAGDEAVQLPFELWLASTSVLIGSVAVRWLTYRHLLGATLRQALGGALAYLALTHVITVASLTAVVGRSASWRRTSKTKPRSQGWSALHAVRTELLLGLGCIATAVFLLAVNRHGGVATMLAIGLAVQGVTYLAAPVVVAIAEHELRRQVDQHVSDGTEAPNDGARPELLEPSGI